MPKNFSIYAPFSKVIQTESGGREVWGYATLERVDKSNEIADFDGTLKAFETWSSEIEKNSQGKSKGNIRIMHQPETGGTVIDWQASTAKIDENGEEKEVKGIWVGSHIPAHKVDVIADIDAGLLSAYSIGGSYAKKWLDVPTGAKRYIPVMSELSLVDNPAVPGAEFQLVKFESGPWEKKKGSDEGMTAEALAKAAAAAGITVEQMTVMFAELAKAEKPVDGDGDSDNNKEFPAKDDEAKKDDADAAAEDDGVKKDDMEAAAEDDGVTKTVESDLIKSVSDLLAELDIAELAKSGASISEHNRGKLHKAAGHIMDTCKCAKCMKAAGIYADPDGTNNGEEPQEPPVKKEADADLQKAVGISFAQELEKAELVKQGDLAKFASEVSEMAKAVSAISTTIDAMNKAVEAVGKQVETFEKSANDRLQAIEDAPVSGGPLLFGAGGPNGNVPLQKSIGETALEHLNKALELTTDPILKDSLSRQVATLEYKNQRQGV